MADYTNAWLSYKMKALTNYVLWSRVSVVTDEKMNPVPQTVETAVKEILRAGKELFGRDMEIERKNASFFGAEPSAAELKNLTGCEFGFV